MIEGYWALSINFRENKILLIEGTCQCDFPNPFLYQSNGKMNMRLNNFGSEFPLESKNIPNLDIL